jgi:uncharacterized protein YjiS (DUF1127 family)
MFVFRLFSNLWKVWKAADCEVRQLQALNDKPGGHLLRDAGIARHEIADILSFYRSKQLLAVLIRFEAQQ